MSVLVFSDKIREDIAQAITKARANPVPWEALQSVATLTPKNDMEYDEERQKKADELYRLYPSQSLILGNVRVAFSFEYQPSGLYRHISFSVQKKGKVLDFIPAQELAKAFGFSGLPPTNPYSVWTEEYEPGMYAINIMELEESNGSQDPGNT
jgi:hypothetical protein